MRPTPRFHRLHFVGVGGSGMGPLAELLLARGFQVSGSDQSQSETLQRLRELGAKVYVGHRKTPALDAHAVIYSAAIPEDNPEMEAAARLGIPVIKRAQCLGALMRTHYSLAVAGTHGKTTTTAMLGRIWMEAGRSPSLVVGGAYTDTRSGAMKGEGEVLIAEADEYDRSFLSLWPTVALVTNVEEEHMDVYGSAEDLQQAFAEFCNRVPFYGQLVLNQDDPGCRAVREHVRVPVKTFGLTDASDYRATEIVCDAQGSCFSVLSNGKPLGEVKLQLTGTHNVYNALGSLALSVEEGISFETAARALSAFTGVKRRLELVGTVKGIRIMDDYAHHPTEVKAVLQAASQLGARRVVAVFQPHLYSRTRKFQREFGQALLNSDVLLVTSVYASREKAIPGVEGDSIALAARDAGHKQVQFVAHMDQAAALLGELLQDGDLVLTIGAGNIGELGPRLLEALEQRQ